MLTTINTYRNLKARGLRRAWEISGMPEVGDKLVGYTLRAVFIGLCLYLLSDYANSAQIAAGQRAAEAVKANAGEIEALRKIVAACVGDREGVLWIGGEMHLCKAVPTGVMK